VEGVWRNCRARRVLYPTFNHLTDRSLAQPSPVDSARRSKKYFRAGAGINQPFSTFEPRPEFIHMASRRGLDNPDIDFVDFLGRAIPARLLI
jgi:hypothetical protein